VTAAPRAADLPVGSQIRVDHETVTLTATFDGERWANNDGGSYTEGYLDEMLDAGRAVVLRIGDGTEN